MFQRIFLVQCATEKYFIIGRTGTVNVNAFIGFVFRMVFNVLDNVSEFTIANNVQLLKSATAQKGWNKIKRITPEKFQDLLIKALTHYFYKWKDRQ